MKRTTKAKRLWLVIATIISVLVCALCFVACGDNTTDSTDDNQNDGHTSHNYTATETVDPTCVDRGYTVYTCTCGDSYIDDYVDATGEHTYTTYTYNNDEDCGFDGTETATCDVCHAVPYTRTKANTATGLHEFNGYICSVCGDYAPNAPITHKLCYGEIKEDDVVVAYSVSGPDTGLLRIRIPKTYNDKPVIRVWGFSYDNDLMHIDIPISVKEIEGYAFRDCSNLPNIVIPKSVTSIGREAFKGCSSLTSIKVPDSVTSIGKDAFVDTAYYDNESNWEDGVLYIGKHLIRAKDTISGEYTVKPGTLTIADNAFEGCNGLTSIVIPNSVTKISEGAFTGCGNLTNVTIPNSVKSIGRDAFTECTGLTSIEIPNSVTSIEYYAFSGCSSLTSVNS